MLSAGIGSLRGRDALNGGGVHVQQLGSDVAVLGGGVGILDFALYTFHIQSEGQPVLLIPSVLRGRLQGDADRIALVNRTAQRSRFVVAERQRASIELVLRQIERGMGLCVTIIAIRRRASIGLSVGTPVKLDAGVDLVWLIKWGGAAGTHRVAGTLQNSDGIA